MPYFNKIIKLIKFIKIIHSKLAESKIVMAVVAFLVLVLHELLVDLDVVAEVTLVAVRTTAQVLELAARLYLAPVVQIRIRLATLAVNELLADAVFGQFMGVRCDWLVLVRSPCVVKPVVTSRVLAVVVEVHIDVI